MIRDGLLEQFSARHNQTPTILVRAPGRANLIGEHTDYSDGFVMPFALDKALYVAARPRADGVLNLASTDFNDESTSVDIATLAEWGPPHWARAIKGAWMLLLDSSFELSGADVVMASDIPIGAGLSSSAAAEVAAIETALALINESTRMTQLEKALLAVRIEHQFLNMPSGNMDQIASAASPDGSAIVLDCRSLEMQRVALPSGYSTLLLNTMVSHNLAESEYPVRRQEVESAAALIGVKALRDATMEMVEANKGQLGDVRYRRAKHVVTENDRVHAMRQALEVRDLQQVGALLDASHHSLSRDYEVSCEESDILSELARGHAAVLGARQMGGGFGGCIICLVEADKIDEVAQQTIDAYQEKTGINAEYYTSAPSKGASVELL